jgi:hypothetical protein
VWNPRGWQSVLNLWDTLGMTKLTPKNKAKRQEVRSERKAAKQQRKDIRERTKSELAPMSGLEQQK